ncbi:unnamed protein product [Caenorhabditis brenneri]
MTQSGAEAECGRLYGAPLIGLFNKLDNEFVDTYTQYLVENVWIGLTCHASNNDSCSWSLDRGAPMFQNFTVNNPNVTNGNCMSQVQSTRFWSSTQCTEKLNFLCGMPEIKEDPCTNQYNEYCYFPVSTTMKFGDAQKYCAKNCANLPSINSALENHYINSMFKTETVTMLGAVATSKTNIIWAENLDHGYNNLQNFTKENCVFTTLNSNNGQTGKWFTDSCTRETVFICKRPIGIKCDGGDF